MLLHVTSSHTKRFLLRDCVTHMRYKCVARYIAYVCYGRWGNGRFPDNHFPGQTFPGKTFPGQLRALTRRLFPVQDVSRTIIFPDRRFPDNLYK